MATVNEHLKQIQDAVDIIQQQKKELQDEHQEQADEFIILNEFEESINQVELDLHRVTTTFEHRL